MTRKTLSTNAETRALKNDGLLQTFAEAAELIAATPKKLEKAARLGAYFHTLDDRDLARAARYFAGHQFPLSDVRTTNVGTSTLRDALGEATGIEVEALRPRYVRLGDSGEVACEVVLESKGAEGQPTITLSEDEIDTLETVRRLAE